MTINELLSKVPEEWRDWEIGVGMSVEHYCDRYREIERVALHEQSDGIRCILVYINKLPDMPA